MRSLMLGLLGLLVLAGCDRQSPAPVQADRSEAAAVQPDEVQPDEVQPDAVQSDGATASAGVVAPDFSHKGAAAPATGFVDPAGKPVTLAAFRGRPVLVNLWATWCAPCVAELPTLAAVAKREGGKLVVLTVNQDTDGAKAAPFLARRGVALPAYTDPQVGLSVAFAANLPTTVLYGADGKERWRLTGGMDWSGPDGTKLLTLAE